MLNSESDILRSMKFKNGCKYLSHHCFSFCCTLDVRLLLLMLLMLLLLLVVVVVVGSALRMMKLSLGGLLKLKFH